ncbi:MAG TPA: OmpA family protein [Anseongella sp.]
MKKLIFTLLMAMMASAVLAQNGTWQINASGGISMPLGTYKNYIGRANDGPFAALSVDRYLNDASVRWGIGVDLRFLRHSMRPFDTLFFTNGYMSTDYHNEPRFTHMGAALGPTAAFKAGPVDLELFLRGGILLQQFPSFTRSVWVQGGGGGMVNVLDNHYTNNPENRALAWMGLGGARISYPLTERFSISLQADYLRTFGKTFGKDPSRFQVVHHGNFKEPDPDMEIKLGADDSAENLAEYFSPEPQHYNTFVQALNLSAGIRYTFGGKKSSRKKARKSRPVTRDPYVKPAPSGFRKDILIVVKDEQTGLPLSGVKVDIRQGETVYTSITNVNGEAERIEKAAAGRYEVTGIKNGIEATGVVIGAAEFETPAPVIYKEILHNDPRFTLVGVTVDAVSREKLAGIGTILTNTGTAANVRQQSDPEGKFIYQLDQNSGYHVVANQAGKFSQTEEVSTKGLNRSQTLYVTLELGTSDIVKGATFVLKNIHYDFDRSEIRPDAARILDNVANVLRQNPTLQIELSSHTDSRGSDNYNLRLSQERATAAVNYLVSKGIGRNRLSAKGYGETKLLNACANGVSCSDEEHQANRRTEISVLEY